MTEAVADPFQSNQMNTKQTESAKLIEARPATDEELEAIRQDDIKKNKKKEIDSARYAKDTTIKTINLEITELKNSLLNIKSKKKVEAQNILIKKKKPT